MTDKKHSPLNSTRRAILKGAAAATVSAGALGSFSTSAWAAGSDAPEKAEVKVGFIPLTDCASVVVASELGFDKKYGIKITPSKEASWAGVRDKLANGELDAAHVLYGLIYGLQLGTSGPQKDMSVLMSLNNNGQAITLSNQLKEIGAIDGASLKKAVAEKKRDYTFAQTFPTGTHAMWLYYWLANSGINPLTEVKCIVVPPPQMVANMRVGNMDGYCVGEPWGARAIADDIGFTAVTTQEIWQDHPEKVLGASAEFTSKYPNTARALTAAVLDAAKFIDDIKNRENVAKLIAGKSYVNTDASVILGRFMGQYENGLGKKWTDDHAMKFYNDGTVNFPYLSDAMWFLTQHKRWGLLKDHPDYLAVAKKVNQIDIYKAAAAMTKTPVPADAMRKSTLIDGKEWNGSDPKAYADSFAIKA